MTPEELIGRMQKGHEEDFAGFGISFDNYHSTHSDENKSLSEGIYNSLKKAGLIEMREVEQLYDPVRKQFLADRYIRGTCPNCKADDQPGDNCDSCGATYNATDLESPRSALSGASLEAKSSEHYFFVLKQDGRLLARMDQHEKPRPRPRPEAAAPGGKQAQGMVR